MSDRKTFNKPRGKQAGKGPKQGFASVPRSIPTDTLVVRTSWTLPALSSGTAGELSSSISSSIQNASEYSVLASLYREVKLVSHDIEFFWYNPYSTSGTNAVTTTVVLGTDMRMNGTTFTLPTAYIDVYNASDRRTFARTNPMKVRFRRQVPKNLEHTNIADDCPTLPVPYAGSPGVIQVFSSGNQVSTQLTTILLCSATYHLKGRI